MGEADTLRRNRDYEDFYDTTFKRNYLTLGYFGGGPINYTDFRMVAKLYAKELDVPIDTIYIDEILSSRRYKGFKVMWSSVKNQKPIDGSFETDNVYAFLSM